MILILRHGATEAELEHVVQRVEALGLTAHISRGTYRTIIGLIGDEDKTREAPLRAIPGVADVIPVLPLTNLPVAMPIHRTASLMSRE